MNVQEPELNTSDTPYYICFLDDVIIFKDDKYSGFFFHKSSAILMVYFKLFISVC